MACIGTFSFYDGKYSGSISTLTVNAKATIVQNEATGDNTPTHLVMVGGAQVGAGWTKTAQESGAKYLSIKLDDPSFPAPVFARLVERGDLHELYWTREPVRAERAERAA